MKSQIRIAFVLVVLGSIFLTQCAPAVGNGNGETQIVVATQQVEVIVTATRTCLWRCESCSSANRMKTALIPSAEPTSRASSNSRMSLLPQTPTLTWRSSTSPGVPVPPVMDPKRSP
jgi:hypothetical protein